jgi:hypothetical protein
MPPPVETDKEEDRYPAPKGVLTITAAKREPTKSREIEVKGIKAFSNLTTSRIVRAGRRPVRLPTSRPPSVPRRITKEEIDHASQRPHVLPSTLLYA